MASTVDPYYTAKTEVQHAVDHANTLLERLKHEATTRGSTTHSRKIVADLQSEIANELRQLEYDMQDLDSSIAIASSNPAKYQLTESELQSRRAFVTTTKETIKELKKTAAEPKLLVNASHQSQPTPQFGTNTITSREAEIDRRNANFMKTQQSHQQVMRQQQDQQLEELAESAERLNQTALVINHELEDQQRMLIELDEDIDRETEKMNFVMRRMAKLLQTNDTKTLWIIIWLVLLLFLMVLLVLYV